MPEGIVFNVQRYSVQDGPGIRTTIFLKGCPLDCAWCHNPEGISFKPQTLTIETRCIRCGDCLHVCSANESVGRALSPRTPSSDITPPPNGPFPARVANNSQPTAQPCSLCGACVEACPTGARQMVGTRMSVDNLLATVQRDRMFFDESGGGVTFSGGEPLAQAAFVREALRRCRQHGIHTTVDTCGYVPQRDLLDVAQVTDLFLYDVKIMDEASHMKFTGRSNKLILENVSALAAVHDCIWLRVPVIPGINDSVTEFEAIAALASSMPGVKQVNLLPYHRNGSLKAERVRRDDRMAATSPPPAETMGLALSIFRRAGVRVLAGG